jgi:hypothetical protein
MRGSSPSTAFFLLSLNSRQQTVRLATVPGLAGSIVARGCNRDLAGDSQRGVSQITSTVFFLKSRSVISRGRSMSDSASNLTLSAATPQSFA